MAYHEHLFEPRFHDPSDWDCASYTPDICAELGEPAPDFQSDYRAAALARLRMLRAIDAYMTDSENPRLAWITIAITLDLTSTCGLSVAEIASQTGVSPAALRCATAKFRQAVGLDPGGSIQAIPTRA